LVAVLLGVALLEEPVQLTPGTVTIGLAGLAATITGIWALTRPAPPATPP
jgi:hypothetical protein